MKREAKYTKAGNYLLRSTRSRELVEFAILVKHGRVRRDGKGNGAQITKKDGTWAGNAHWSMLMFLNRGLAEYAHKGPGVELTALGREMLGGACEMLPSASYTGILHKIDSKKID